MYVYMTKLTLHIHEHCVSYAVFICTYSSGEYTQRRDLNHLWTLLVYFIAISVVCIIGTVIVSTGIEEVSRRMANLSFGLWIVSTSIYKYQFILPTWHVHVSHLYLHCNYIWQIISSRNYFYEHLLLCFVTCPSYMYVKLFKKSFLEACYWPSFTIKHLFYCIACRFFVLLLSKKGKLKPTNEFSNDKIFKANKIDLQLKLYSHMYKYILCVHLVSKYMCTYFPSSLL